MSTEDTRVYGIGLYDDSRMIPPGTWGYIADAWEPTLRLGGPQYTKTDQEQALQDEYSALLVAEMTQRTAPATIEMLLKLAQPDVEDPAIQAEKGRIIGSDIHYVSDDHGESGTIEDLRVDTSDDGDVLVVALKDTKFFTRNGEETTHRPSEWSFPLAGISDYGCNNDAGHRFAISFRYKDQDRVFFIKRTPRDPKVYEAYAKTDINRDKEWEKFRQSKAAGDYDPRLGAFFLAIANRLKSKL